MGYYSYSIYGGDETQTKQIDYMKHLKISKNEDVLLHKVKPTDYIKVCIDRIEDTLKRKEIEESTLKLFKEPIAEYHILNYSLENGENYI